MKPDNTSRLNNSHQQLEHLCCFTLLHLSEAKKSRAKPDNTSRLHAMLEHLCSLNAVCPGASLQSRFAQAAAVSPRCLRCWFSPASPSAPRAWWFVQAGADSYRPLPRRASCFLLLCFCLTRDAALKRLGMWHMLFIAVLCLVLLCHTRITRSIARSIARFTHRATHSFAHSMRPSYLSTQTRKAGISVQFVS